MGDMVVMKEIQREPVSGKIIHVSFQHIVKGQKFTATIPIHLVHPDVNFGNSGLVLKTIHAKVEVEGTAETMVDHVTVDVSKMVVHDLIRVKDLPAISGIEYLDDPETQVAVLDYSQAEESETDTTEAPVEVIKDAKEAPKA
jgi:large subunit ribosomal protein L25